MTEVQDAIHNQKKTENQAELNLLQPDHQLWLQAFYQLKNLQLLQGTYQNSANFEPILKKNSYGKDNMLLFFRCRELLSP